MKNKIVIILLSISLNLAANSYDLQQVVELALKNSYTLKTKQMELVKSELGIKEAAARLLPQADIQASGTFLSNPMDAIVIPKGSFAFAPTNNSQMPTPVPPNDIILMEAAKSTYFKITTTVKQPVFTWNKIENAVELAKIGQSIDSIGLEKSKQEIVKEISIIYFGIIVSRSTENILSETLNIVKEVASDREKSFTEGLINRQKLLESQRDLIMIESNLFKTKEACITAIEALRFYTGLDEKDIELTTGYRQEIFSMDEQELKEMVLKNSFDLKSLNRNKAQAEKYIEIEKGSALFRPDISLVATLDITGQDIPVVSSNWTETWDTSLNISIAAQMKILDGDVAKYKIEKARQSLGMVLTGLDQMKEGLKLQSRKAVEKVMTDYYTLLEKQSVLELAREQYKNAKSSFDNDLITREEERLAKVYLNNTEMEFNLAQYNYETALIQIEFLAGSELVKRENN